MGRAINVLIDEWIVPLDKKMALQEGKLKVLGLFLSDMGTWAENGGKTFRELLTGLRDIEAVLHAPDYTTLLEEAGSFGVACDANGEFQPVSYHQIQMQGPWVDTPAPDDSPEPIPLRTQDDIIEDVLEQMSEDDLDV